MLRNYLKIAARSLQKRPQMTLINVLGLATGLALCLVIGLWVQNELRYDDFHPDAERIYRLTSDVQIQSRSIAKADAPPPLAPTVAEEIPAVVAATHFRHRTGVTMQRGTKAFTNNAVVFADSAFFDVFGGFEMLRGVRETALRGTNALVLTASTAQRLFGRLDVVGQTVAMNDRTWRVTGVMADAPETSHLSFQAVGSLRLPDGFRESWTALLTYTYVKLAPGASVEAFQRTLTTTTEKYLAPQIEAAFGLSFQAFQEQGGAWGFVPQPLTRIHLHSDLDEEIQANGSIAAVYSFAAIGVFILLLACINFMNLATARASERAVEVGVRKALGARRTQLTAQFLGEAFVLTGLSTTLAIGAVALALPSFNTLANRSLAFSQLLNPVVWIGLLVVLVLVALLAGSYPSFVLSRFASAQVLKAGGRHSSGGQGKRLRQGLVVFQFAVSVALIVGTLVVEKQFSYVQSKQLGLDKAQVVEVQNARALGEGHAAFAQQIERQPGILSSGAGDPLFSRIPEQAFVPDDAPQSDAQAMKEMLVGAGFVETLGIDVVEGRAFDAARRSDSTAVLVNQAAADAFGWTRPLEHTLAEPGDSIRYDVIGVVENFHYASMRDRIRPVVMFLSDSPRSLYVKLAPGAPGEPLQALRQAWRGAVAGDPLEYAFLDQTYAQVHDSIQRTGALFRLFAGLAVVIACLGLFGLATYTVQRRTKEIGIRKALGATAPQVVGLLSKEFVQLIGLAGAVALPVAYVVMDGWLANFAYRTSLGVGLFASALVLTVLVAFLAIGSQALRAARLDPASTLKDE